MQVNASGTCCMAGSFGAAHQPGAATGLGRGPQQRSGRAPTPSPKRRAGRRASRRARAPRSASRSAPPRPPSRPLPPPLTARAGGRAGGGGPPALAIPLKRGGRGPGTVSLAGCKSAAPPGAARAAVRAGLPLPARRDWLPGRRPRPAPRHAPRLVPRAPSRRHATPAAARRALPGRPARARPRLPAAL